MVDFEKNGTKLSLMMFLTTFVPKKIGNVFANVDFHVNPHFAALCTEMNSPYFTHIIHTV